MYEQDYLMRLIHEIIRTLVMLLSGGKGIREETEPDEETDKEGKMLEELTVRGKINEAENLLFAGLDPKNPAYLRMGLLFYEHVNTYSDEELEQCNYSREEIRQGIEMLLGAYGYQGLAGLLDV